MQSQSRTCQLTPLQPYRTEIIIDTRPNPYPATSNDMWWVTPAMGIPEVTESSFVDMLASQKPDSYTRASSIANDRPNSAMTHGTGSYVMVHRRTGSNETSAEGSDNQGYSVPSRGSAAEWASSNDNAIEMDVDDYPSMPHDPNAILLNMGNIEPKRVFNPYSPEPTSSMYQNSPAPRDFSPHMHLPSHPQSRSSSVTSYSRASMLGDGSEPPWTHMHPSRGLQDNYESGYAAFAPSPGLAADQDPDELRNSPSFTVIEYSDKIQKKTDTKARRAKPPLRGRGKITKHEWEHHSVVQRGALKVMTKPEEAPVVRSGIRRGKLDPEAAERARNIRRMTACWNCWMQKVPCSTGRPCDRCRRQFSPNANQVCLRTHFKEYETVFFPDYLHSHLKKRKIDDLVNEHTSGWTDTLLEVDVRAGACFVPMRLIVTMFRPETIEILYQDRLATTTEGQAQRGLIQQSSAPIGLSGVSTTDLKDKCREHIEEMIESLHYAPQVTAGEESRISCMILAAAQRYYMSTRVPLIGQVLMLHAIHYYMKSFVTLTEESANNVYPVMQFYGVTREMYMSSRLLNRQIKYAMHKLSREITVDVLEGLERAMRSRTKDSWGTSFCTFLVLCLCMEGLQIASDTYVVCDMQRAGANSMYNRQQSVAACRKIDENPFNQCKRLFHDIYKSHRESHRVGREGGFNPLANLANNGATGLEQEADNILVNSIYELVTRSYDEIIMLSDKPLVVDENGFGIDPEMIKINGAGRLVGSFLRSFFSPDWRPAD